MRVNLYLCITKLKINKTNNMEMTQELKKIIGRFNFPNGLNPEIHNDNGDLVAITEIVNVDGRYSGVGSLLLYGEVYDENMSEWEGFFEDLPETEQKEIYDKIMKLI